MRHLRAAQIIALLSVFVCSPGSSAGQITADRVVVYKAERRLELHRDGAVIRSYRVALGHNPIGPKLQEGDGRTPEGEYQLDWRNANSKFHRALHISYPNTADRASARKRGVAPGGAIMLHGSPNYLADETLLGELDWTDGCIAVRNSEIGEIWRAVPDGTPITIKP